MKILIMEKRNAFIALQHLDVLRIKVDTVAEMQEESLHILPG